MPRKKKGKINIEWPWSPYQKRIFECIEHDVGNLVIESCAGSGKTSTLIKCLDFIPNDKQILLTAFNNEIVRELKKKTKDHDNVDVRTLHSLGLMILRENLKDEKLIPDVYKYESYIRNNIKSLTSANLWKLKGRDYYRYIDNVIKYINYGRLYLCSTVEDLNEIEARYGIDTIEDEKEVSIKALEWGLKALESIDYTDMVWLPNVMKLTPLGGLYDFIFIDECQDLNKAERELVLRCFKDETRMICVGDENQCIFSFAGADPQSFSILKSLPNTKTLPLSISYRCSENIVDFAKKLVPTIEPNNDGRQGEIVKEVNLDDVEDGDMILCRNNAPLIQAYSTLLKDGKKAFIRGKEIGSSLKTMVNRTKKKMLFRSLTDDGVFIRLYDDLFATRNTLMEQYAIDEESAMKSQVFQNKLDAITTLEILADGLNTTDELVNKIENIFSKSKETEGIALSTIHKAKGLEANNVFILCESLMPSKSAKRPWEIRQEQNLMYVAYTRAKNKLGFISEKGFEKFDTASSISIKRLKQIETSVRDILHKKTEFTLNEQTARKYIENMKNREPIKIEYKQIELNKSANTRKLNSFADILKKKKRR